MSAALIDDKWVQLAYSVSATRSLVCFPFAGGSALSFVNWINAFRNTVNLYVAEPGGRGWRDGCPPAHDFLARVEEYARGICSLDSKELVLFGHSMGALIAFEVARRVTCKDRSRIVRLIVSSRGEPCSFTEPPPLEREAMVSYLKSLGGTPDFMFENEAVVDRLLMSVMEDFGCLRTYKFSPLESRFLVPISCLGGDHDVHVPFRSLLGWRSYTKGAFDLRLTNGGHFSVMKEPHMILEAALR